MREAIGSSWLFYLIIIFLLIYVFFMSFVMNYASTYRAANYVVTQIEVCQAENRTDCVGKDINSITNAIREKYHYVQPSGRSIDVCCVRNGNGAVYRVKLPVAFDVPMLGTINWITVRAETKTILNKTCPGSGFNECR